MSDFNVKILPEKYCGNLLSVTYNGYQWTGLTLKTDDDIEKVIKTLNEYLDNKQLADNSEQEG